MQFVLVTSCSSSMLFILQLVFNLLCLLFPSLPDLCMSMSPYSPIFTVEALWELCSLRCCINNVYYYIFDNGAQILSEIQIRPICIRHIPLSTFSGSIHPSKPKSALQIPGKLRSSMLVLMTQLDFYLPLIILLRHHQERFIAPRISRYMHLKKEANNHVCLLPLRL